MLSKINKIVYSFKESIWNDDIKDIIIFFTFIIVSIYLLIPNLEKAMAGVFSLMIILLALSFTLDRIYNTGIIIEPTFKDKSKHKNEIKRTNLPK